MMIFTLQQQCFLQTVSRYSLKYKIWCFSPACAKNIPDPPGWIPSEISLMITEPFFSFLQSTQSVISINQGEAENVVKTTWKISLYLGVPVITSITPNKAFPFQNNQSGHFRAWSWNINQSKISKHVVKYVGCKSGFDYMANYWANTSGFDQASSVDVTEGASHAAGPRPADQLAAKVERGQHQPEHGKVSKSSPHPFFGISCRVPMCIHLSAYDPHNSKSTGKTRTVQSTEGEAKQKGGVDLQSVLVSTLDAVEHISIFWVVTVHLRVRHIVLLAGFANFPCQMSNHHHTGNTSHQHKSILLWKHTHPVNLRCGSPTVRKAGTTRRRQRQTDSFKFP